MAEKKQESEDKEKKSSKMIVIIIVAVVLLLGGGGAAYYFLWMDQASESADDEQEDTDDEESSSEEDKSEVSEILYYDIKNPLVVDFPPGSFARLIQVSVSLQVANQETVDALTKHDPMIRNNLLMLISKEGADSLNTREGKEKLREAMLQEVGKILQKLTGKNQIKEMFYTSFVMQ